MLRLWERKLLRMILGGKTENGYIRRTNEEIFESYQKPQIYSIIKARRLKRLGHMERVTEERTVRRIAWKTPGYKKKRGRLRKRWREVVLQNMEDKEIANWRRKAMDGGGWKRITKLCLKAFYNNNNYIYTNFFLNNMFSIQPNKFLGYLMLFLH